MDTKVEVAAGLIPNGTSVRTERSSTQRPVKIILAAIGPLTKIRVEFALVCKIHNQNCTLTKLQNK